MERFINLVHLINAEKLTSDFNVYKTFHICTFTDMAIFTEKILTNNVYIHPKAVLFIAISPSDCKECLSLCCFTKLFRQNKLHFKITLFSILWFFFSFFLKF